MLHSFITYLLFASCFCVDRSNFKTCDQSGFCKRQRNIPANESPYAVLLDSASLSDTQLSVQVLNKKSQVKFLLVVTILKNQIVRVRMTEASPLIPRFEPPIGDVLLSEPEKDSFKVDSRSGSHISLVSGGTSVSLHADPLRIDISLNGTPLASINSRGLLKFEHTRTKPAPAATPTPTNGDTEEVEKDDSSTTDSSQPPEETEPDLWDENYKSHPDSKPNGPQSVGADISFPGFEFVYGIPEHADSLALKSTKDTDPYRLYNLDVFQYELHNPMALYGSVPLMLAHNEQNTIGLFWLNAAETFIDIGSNTADKGMFGKMMDFVKGGDSEIPQVDTHWFSESGIIDMFVLLGPSPGEVFAQYAQLTGTTQRPPLFSIAYHQCRWNYNDQEDVTTVNAEFDKHQIPMDVIWLDIEHTDGKRYFTWDGKRFPNSVEMINNVASKGRKMVTIIDPHIKRDSGYKIHQEAQSLDMYIKDKSGNEYDGWCWPGSSSYLDFTAPRVRDYWASRFSLDEYKGSTLDLFTWNDMNEPSVFNGPEVTLHKDAKHIGGWEHRDVHNLYALYVQRATVDGLLRRSDGKLRPFVLGRGFFAGTQRYGAVWTGDNTADWGHLKISIPMLLSLNLVGMTFSGADVGGFFNNPDPELLTRWYQAGAFQPFFRAHAHIDTKRREPWLLPEENMKIIRDAIKIRYQYLPLWYTLFMESESSGQPIMKALWVNFPTERITFAIDDSYMLGNSLFVKPVLDPGVSSISLYLPDVETVWYDIAALQPVQGGKTIHIPVEMGTIPVYIRGGTIVPRKDRPRRSSALMKNDPYTLVIALDQKGSASGTLYLDDFESFNYQQGEYIYRKFIMNEEKSLTSEGLGKGRMYSDVWIERIVIAGFKKEPTKIEINYNDIVTRGNFKYKSGVLILRKPGMKVRDNWSITFL